MLEFLKSSWMLTRYIQGGETFYHLSLISYIRGESVEGGMATCKGTLCLIPGSRQVEWMKSKKNLSPHCSYVCIRLFLEEIRQQQPDLVVLRIELLLLMMK